MKFSYLLWGMFAFFVCLSPQLWAEIIPFNAVIEISGATPPEGTPAWLSASFDDNNSPGSVTLTLVAENLTDAEFVSDWHFNLDPSLDPDALEFAIISKTGAFDDPTIDTDTDQLKAGGDGYSDILFSFETSNGPSTRFGVGDALTLQITGIATLTAQSFNWTTSPGKGGGDKSGYIIVAHVQGVGPNDDDSGWVATPEPSSFFLVILGLLGLVFLDRQRRI